VQYSNIVQVTETEHLMEICKKAHEVFPDTISPDIYYQYLRIGIFELRIIALVTFNDGVMTSCAVLCFGKDLINQPTITTDFMWIDPHYPTLFKEYLKYVEKIVNEKGIKRIIIPTCRNEKAFERKYGKYGFMKTYTVFEKKVS